MSSAAEARLLERIEAAPVDAAPFPHCVVDEVFEHEFYEDLMDHWPADEEFVPLADTGRTAGGYSRERLVVPLAAQGLARLSEHKRRFWSEAVARWLLGAAVLRAACGKFGIDPAGATMHGDGLIVSDRTRFAIGPHTDAPHRMVSLLFYLPEDAAFGRHGTSLYVPLDPAFRCAGGPHYLAQHFRRVKTVAFVPNRLLMFPKSDRCFHGVEPVDLPGIERRLLICDVRRAPSATSGRAR